MSWDSCSGIVTKSLNYNNIISIVGLIKPSGNDKQFAIENTIEIVVKLFNMSKIAIEIVVFFP